MDITYTTGKMFTTFYSESKEGDEIWREMANKMDGVAKVLNFEANKIIHQIRNAGFIVKKAQKTNLTIDEILDELNA